MHLEVDLIALPAEVAWAGARPPYLWPRCKLGIDAEIQALRDWIFARLTLNAGVSVSISEWVSFDSREVPHTTRIAIRDGDRSLTASIGKPIARIALTGEIHREP
jgi:hypothetical protein